MRPALRTFGRNPSPSTEVGDGLSRRKVGQCLREDLNGTSLVIGILDPRRC
jgi:hypothetical protein